MPKTFSEFFLNIARKKWDALKDWKSDNTGIVFKKDAWGNYRLFYQPLTTGKITAVTGLWIKELIKFPSLNTRQCAFTGNGSPIWQRFMAFPQKEQRPSAQMLLGGKKSQRRRVTSIDSTNLVTQYLNNVKSLLCLNNWKMYEDIYRFQVCTCCFKDHFNMKFFQCLWIQSAVHATFYICFNIL